MLRHCRYNIIPQFIFRFNKNTFKKTHSITKSKFQINPLTLLVYSKNSQSCCRWPPVQSRISSSSVVRTSPHSASQTRTVAASAPGGPPPNQVSRSLRWMTSLPAPSRLLQPRSCRGLQFGSRLRNLNDLDLSGFREPTRKFESKGVAFKNE